MTGRIGSVPGAEIARGRAAYRPDIDGLRALAVIAVIVNHMEESLLPSGYLGVDVFFVISGFVITASMAGRPSASFGEFVSAFYTRRVKRLVPALVLFTVVTSLLICLFNPGPGVSLRTGMAALFGVSNLYLLWEATDYFAAAADINVFTHTWSLGVEEQFYALFPPLLWLTGFGRQVAAGSRNLLRTMASLSVVSLVAFVVLHGVHQPAAYYLMPTRLWELAAGCMLFVALQEPGRALRAVGRVPATVPLVGIVAVMLLPVSLAVPATTAVVAFTAATITCLSLSSTPHAVLTHPKVVWVGLVSYSLYLWHWGVLSLSRWTIGIHAWTAPLQLAAMFLLAGASFRWMERPLRHAEWSPSRLRSIGYGVGATVAAAGVAVVLFLGRSWLYTGHKYLGPTLHEENAIRGTSVTQQNCMLSGGRSFTEREFGQCHLAAADEKPTVFFVGSSHAMHLAGLGERLHEKGLGVAFLTTQGRSFIPEPRSTPEGFGFGTAQNEAIFSLVRAKARQGDVVVVANRYAQSGYEDTYSDGYYRGVGKVAEWLGARGITVVHFLPLQEYAFHDINQCAPQWFNAGMIGSGICLPVDPGERTRQSKELETRFPRSRDLLHFDPIRVLCPSGIEGCSPMDTGRTVPTFRNPDHLSNHGAALLTDEFVRFLGQHKLVKGPGRGLKGAPELRASRR